MMLSIINLQWLGANKTFKAQSYIATANPFN